MKNGANAARAKSAMSSVAVSPRRWSGNARQHRRRESRRRLWIGTLRSNPHSIKDGTPKMRRTADLPDTVASETHREGLASNKLCHSTEGGRQKITHSA